MMFIYCKENKELILLPLCLSLLNNISPKSNTQNSYEKISSDEISSNEIPANETDDTSYSKSNIIIPKDKLISQKKNKENLALKEYQADQKKNQEYKQLIDKTFQLDSEKNNQFREISKIKQNNENISKRIESKEFKYKVTKDHSLIRRLSLDINNLNKQIKENNKKIDEIMLLIQDIDNKITKNQDEINEFFK